QVLELDVLERHFHDVAAVELPGDDAFLGHLGKIIVNGSLSIKLDCDMLSHAVDVIVVELFGLESFLDHFAWGLLHHAAEFLSIKAAPELLSDVTLRTFDPELLTIEDFTANLHTAVTFAVFQANLERQLEVLVFLFAAQEGIERHFLLAARSNDRAILD